MKTIFTNGKIYTFNKNEPFVEAIVTNGERIEDLGSYQDMKLAWGSSDTRIVDLGGKAVLPGLIDSHLHISSVGITSLELDLTGVKSKDDLLQRIKFKAETLQPGEWILGRGWDENIFPDKKIPVINELDYVAPGNPLFLPRVCGHAFLANSKAFEIAGYHDELSVPFGGTVVKDEYNQPNGLLLETASNIITSHIPKMTYAHLKKALSLGMQESVRLGLTGIHTNDPTYLYGVNQTYKLFDEIVNMEGIGPRSNLLIDYQYLDELKEAGMYAGYGNNKVMIGAIKFFADGALGGRTAHLSKEYADDPGNFGSAIYEKEQLFRYFQECRDYDMPIAVHTIGDHALTDVLDILDRMEPVRFRDRLIHVSLLNEELIKRLKSPHRIVDLQPKFVSSDFPWIVDRIGEERAKFAYPFKTLLDNGVICAGSSDAPIEPLNPLLGIHAAVTRRKEGETHGGYIEYEKLSMYEAIEMFTLGGAFATNEEHEKGSLERGKLADMTVLSNDPFTMDSPDELIDTEVELTIIGGEVKFQK